MSGNNLRAKTVSAMLWSSVGKFGTMGISFVSNMVLARLLMPEDFGLIGMLHIFIAVSEVFVLGGFGQALIQKKTPTHIDYTTVFYWNLFASILLYWILFLCGPAIARFYDMPPLCKVLRIQSLILIISAFSVVQSNQLMKQLRFRALSIRSLAAACAGTTVAIIMAFKGYGVWSLVASSLVSSVVSVFLLWGQSKWRPTFEFSWQSFKELFAFGGLMALSSLVDRLYSELQGLIIGKRYSATDLGYYSQAHKLEQVPTSAISQIVSQVSFPVFSALQDDKTKLLAGVRKNLTAVSYLNFAFSILLIVIGAPLIRLVYGPNWDPAIPYFQILCFASMMFTTNSLNNQVIKALGKSNIYLYANLAKRGIGIALVFVGAIFGIWGLLCAVALNSYIFYIISASINKRLLGYGIPQQLKDIGGNFIVAAVAGVATYLLGSFVHINQYLMLFIQIVFYSCIFLCLSKLFQLTGLNTFIEVLKSRKR